MREAHILPLQKTSVVSSDGVFLTFLFNNAAAHRSEVNHLNCMRFGDCGWFEPSENRRESRYRLALCEATPERRRVQAVPNIVVNIFSPHALVNNGFCSVRANPPAILIRVKIRRE
jgi:hypothetical protein